ncbi:MAG: M48 family metallopeptidase [Elusimicrobia bacterium]|nr:M48 family metallopeptidase [Elusimicrobiota bacterium]
MAPVETFRFPHRGGAIRCRIQRGKRSKTMALRVSTEGLVTVLVPADLADSKARQFAKSRAEWISSQRRYFATLARAFPRKEFVSGESLKVNGKPYRLKFIPSTKTIPFCRLRGRRLVVSAPGPHRARETIINFFFDQTLSKVQPILKRLGPSLGFPTPKIKIVDQENRWASCSKNKILRFNWKLGMVPPFVLNYVVAHEVCHLKHPNHSIGFWRTLRALNPRAEVARQWLRQNSGLLRII